MKISNLAKKSPLETKEGFTIEKNANMKSIGMEVVTNPQTFEAVVTSPKTFEAVITDPQAFEAVVTSPKAFEAVLDSSPTFNVTTVAGRAGKSAYDIWLDEGNEGTQGDFLNSLTKSMLRYKGGADTFADLPAAEFNDVGDFWNVKDTDFNFVWDGLEWDQVSGLTDLSNYVDRATNEAALGNKVDKVSGKGLSTNDFTNTLKRKLEGIDFKGYAHDITYDEINHILKIPMTDEEMLVVDFPIEMLVKNIALNDDNNLVMTFENGDTTIVPIGVFLQGVVREVNGKNPNALGVINLSVDDIPNLRALLDDKTNIDDIKDGTTVVKKAEQDENGNNIKDTYATVAYVDTRDSELEGDIYDAIDLLYSFEDNIAQLEFYADDLYFYMEDLYDIKQDKLVAGNNITIDEDNVISADDVFWNSIVDKPELYNKSEIDQIENDMRDEIWFSTWEMLEDIDKKQDKLVAGNNIHINPDTNVISASVKTINWQDVQNKPKVYDKGEIEDIVDNKVSEVDIMIGSVSVYTEEGPFAGFRTIDGHTLQEYDTILVVGNGSKNGIYIVNKGGVWQRIQKVEKFQVVSIDNGIVYGGSMQKKMENGITKMVKKPERSAWRVLI